VDPDGDIETVEQLADLVRAIGQAQADQLAVTADSRALREESRQARRHAESVRERARALAALASELQGQSRLLRDELVRGRSES
jgi:hypothetical protein